MSWAEIVRLDPPKVVARGDVAAIYTHAFRFSFRPDLVEALKAAIPWHDRAWDEGVRTWYVTQPHLDTLKALALSCDEATLVEGKVTTDVKSGRVTEQLEMFGG